MRLESLVRPSGQGRAGLTVVDGRGRRHAYTFDELRNLVVRTGRALAGEGVRPGDMVATVVENGIAGIAGALGVWAAGATLVSLPPVPRRARDIYREGFAPVLDVLGCQTFLGRQPFAELFGADARVLQPDLSGEPAGPDPEPTLDGLALVQFTSGSVGRPKGVALTATTLAGHVDALGAALAADPGRDRGVSWVPLYHDMGLIAVLLTLLGRRVPLTVLTPTGFVLNARGWMAECADARATMTIGADFAFRLATRAAAGAAVPDLSSLRYVFTGGERVAWSTLADFHAAFAPGGLRWETLTPMYGLAEATAVVTMPPSGRGPIQGHDGSVSVGRPLPGIELEAGGVVRLRSPWLMEGYVGAGGLEPAAADGWLTTSDQGYIEDDELYVQGRADEVVIQAGRNHFAEDVEAVVLRAVRGPAVGVSAFRAPDDPARFALALEVAELSPGAARALARSVQGATASALGIRVSPVLVLKPWTIPRTTSGKVRRPECRAMLADDRWPAPRVLAMVS